MQEAGERHDADALPVAAAGAAVFHDIPVSRRAIVEAMVEELRSEPPEVDEERETGFRALARLLEALFHFELHARLEAMKARYEPFDPERRQGLGPEPQRSPEELRRLGARFTQELAAVLEKGNYRRLGREALEHALAERSLFPIEVEVDFEAYDELIIYARGETIGQGEVKRLFGLRTQVIDVPTYERVCLYLRFKPEESLPPGRRRPPALDHGPAILKLFRNIPKADLEMLFPNTRLRMRLVDKLLIGVPAVVGGVPVAAKLAPALLALAVFLGLQGGEVNSASLIAGLSGLVALGAWMFKQWDTFKNRKVLFMKLLSENLYFRNLDNNQGVLTRLIDEAEEEECKEALLAYTFLLRGPGQTERALDEAIEAWFLRRFGLTVDFEVDDALAKLTRLGLARRDDEGGYHVVGIAEALALLDHRWDHFFDYPPPDGDPVGTVSAA